MRQSEMKPGRGGTRVSMVGAGRLAGKALTVCGAVLCLSPVGFWLRPESLAEPGAVAIRVALTCVLGGIGFCLFRLGRPDDADGDSPRTAAAKSRRQATSARRAAGRDAAAVL